MLMRPFFSVIICAFDRAGLLPRALDSLLAQSEQDWEAVVVDDGSTDATPEVVQNYADRDPRIRLVQHAENRGVSAARNTGIENSSGLFVTFLDSDDEYAPDHLASRHAMLLDNDSVRLLHGGVKIIGDPFVIDKDDPSRKIHLDECIIGGTFVVRRDVFEEVGGFGDVQYADDTLFFERAAEAGIPIMQTDHPSYIYYRNVPDQLTSNYAP